MVADQYQKDRRGASTQTMVTFNTGCLKFKFANNIIASCFQLLNFGGKSSNFHQMKKFCISQGSSVTFSGKQVYKKQCQISSRFYVRKIIKIGLFLTELYDK